ncbi:MAG: hypothetical protein JWM32_1358 [Verrucomicrobia bacterium]|nr:hypothetical protein [Verrucomicrobiota bacterium]
MQLEFFMAQRRELTYCSGVKRFLLVAWFGASAAFAALNLTAAAAAAAPTRLHAVELLETGQPVRIVAFGDSITGVYYHTGGRRAWCDLVGVALHRVYPSANIEMINAGISGNTTTDALKRIDADVLAHHPQLVIVMFGMNDVARSTAEDFRSNLKQIVERIRANGGEVLLMTPNWISPGDANRPVIKVADFAQIMREIGREMNAPVADASRAFQAVELTDHRAWLGLMSDTIHPNLRGHRLFAEEAVRTLTGKRVVLDDLPVLEPGLPWILARLKAKEPVRVVAMKPYDTLIAPALRALFPDAQVEVTTWDAAGKSLVDIEQQAKAIGWSHYREDPKLPKPDLFIVAVPATALTTNDDQYFHAYTWIMNWSLSLDEPGWNCWVILPSVAQPDQDAGQRSAEALALEVIHGQDVPFLRRTAGDAIPTTELFNRELARLLGLPPKP